MAKVWQCFRVICKACVHIHELVIIQWWGTYGQPVKTKQLRRPRLWELHCFGSILKKVYMMQPLAVTCQSNSYRLGNMWRLHVAMAAQGNMWAIAPLLLCPVQMYLYLASGCVAFCGGNSGKSADIQCISMALSSLSRISGTLYRRGSDFSHELWGVWSEPFSQVVSEKDCFCCVMRSYAGMYSYTHLTL